MRQLEGAIKTFYLDRVKTSLAQLGVTEMAISEAASLPTATAGGAGLSTADFVPRIKVRVLAADHIADRVAAVLAGAS
jgi:nitrogen regulatory protein PII